MSRARIPVYPIAQVFDLLVSARLKATYDKGGNNQKVNLGGWTTIIYPTPLMLVTHRAPSGHQGSGG
jgi:hypothetical protein